VAERELGLTPAELRRLQENAVEAAFLTQEEREALSPLLRYR
jgi:adenosine deaminase